MLQSSVAGVQAWCALLVNNIVSVLEGPLCAPFFSHTGRNNHASAVVCKQSALTILYLFLLTLNCTNKRRACSIMIFIFAVSGVTPLCVWCQLDKV